MVLSDGPRFSDAPAAGRPRRRPAQPIAPDYVAPVDIGQSDHLGAFAVTRRDRRRFAVGFEADHDDYQAIMVKALADRLEAFAEWLHERARRERYESGPAMSGDELIAERYRGSAPRSATRRAPTMRRRPCSSGSTRPARASASPSTPRDPGGKRLGLYFAHPAARYFNVGRLGRDQVEDYAVRCGMDRREAETWLRPNLAYEPT